jgi:hypothetical protein
MKGNIDRMVYRIFIASVVVLAFFVMNGCSRTDNPSLSKGEEESATQLTLNETYDQVRYGARLTLTYDAQSNSFKGFVENTTTETLKQVRVEVHLSNGVELGPTTPSDLAPGEQREIELVATSTDFTAWTAHPEVGSGGDSNGEHNAESDNEHQ